MDKPALILLHGAIGSRSQLKPLADLLSDSFEVYRLNFSGHGGEPFQDQFHIDQFAQELKAFILHHRLEPFIFGYSMGGYVALKLAHQHHELTKKIMTLGTKFYWDEEIATKEIKMLNPDKMEEKIPAFAAQLKKRHSPNDWKKVLSETASMMTGLGQYNALSLKQHATIDTPTCVALGSEDKMVTLQETQDVAKALPNGHFLALEGDKHPIEQVDQKRLAQEIRTFMLKD